MDGELAGSILTPLTAETLIGGELGSLTGPSEGSLSLCDPAMNSRPPQFDPPSTTPWPLEEAAADLIDLEGRKPVLKINERVGSFFMVFFFFFCTAV